MPISRNKFTVLSAIVSFVLIGAIANKQTGHKNLQVLPQDISDQKLDSIMQSYNKGLGVTCDFCHQQVKVFPGGLDYAADDVPMKKNAREMMKMTIDINSKWFYFNKNERPEYLNVINCATCHKGEPMPPSL